MDISSLLWFHFSLLDGNTWWIHGYKRNMCTWWQHKIIACFAHNPSIKSCQRNPGVKSSEHYIWTLSHVITTITESLQSSQSSQSWGQSPVWCDVPLCSNTSLTTGGSHVLLEVYEQAIIWIYNDETNIVLQLCTHTGMNIQRIPHTHT